MIQEGMPEAEAENVTEQLPIQVSSPLPPWAVIANIWPVFPGWWVYYHDPKRGRVISAPIAMWALVEYSEEDDEPGDDTEEDPEDPKREPGDDGSDDTDEEEEDEGDDDPDETVAFTQEIRHFVVALSGNVIDYRELPYDVICVLGPSVPDHINYIKGQLILRGLTIGEEGISPMGIN